jgi:hypothetical protein
MIQLDISNVLPDTRPLDSLLHDTNIAVAIVTLGVVAVLVTLIAFSLRDTLSADRAEIIDALSRFVERLTGFFRR